MNSAARTLNFLRAALLAAIAIYVFIGEQISSKQPTTSSMLFNGVAFVAVVVVVMIFVFRRTSVLPAAQTLSSQPDNASMLARWRGGYIVTYALCEAVALFGFTLRILGFGLVQVAPFYVGAILLMLYFGPRVPSAEAAAGLPG
jgi:hypothetical protein